MSDEFDADAMAALATGESTPEPTTDPDDGADDVDETGDADEASTSSTSRGGDVDLKAMLMSTEPDDDLESVESPYDPEAGGLTRMYRGAQKMLGFDGTPAIVDMAVGAVEAIVGKDAGDGSDETDEGGDGDGPLPTAGGAGV